MQDEEAKRRFISIWVQLTKHFKKVKEPQIMFELFNEVVDSTGYLWNQFYKETIQEIRKIDQERYLLVGSNLQNSVFTLKELDLVEDPYVFIIYIFMNQLLLHIKMLHLVKKWLHMVNLSITREIWKVY